MVEWTCNVNKTRNQDKSNLRFGPEKLLGNEIRKREKEKRSLSRACRNSTLVTLALAIPEGGWICHAQKERDYWGRHLGVLLHQCNLKLSQVVPL